jgi:hypothetical protein
MPLPDSCSAANVVDTHSINSSARSRNASGVCSPIAFAVVRLMTRSSLVGGSTGILARCAARRILSTRSRARRLNARDVRCVTAALEESFAACEATFGAFRSLEGSLASYSAAAALSVPSSHRSASARSRWFCGCLPRSNRHPSSRQLPETGRSTRDSAHDPCE